MASDKKTYPVIILGIAVLLCTARVAAAGLSIQPGITLSEEYNDNIFLTPKDPVHDYITRLVPSIHAVYDAPAWQWNLAYAYDYRYYRYKSRSHDSTHDLLFANHTNVVPDFLFLDVSDVYRRVSLDTTHDYTRQSLFLNQSDSNTFNVSPSARLQLTTHTTGTIGYQYRNVWYDDPSAINRSDHSGFLNLLDELSLRTSLTGGIRYTRTDSDILDYDKTDASVGMGYEYSEGSHVRVTLGASRFRIRDSQQPMTGNQGFWEAGISHRFVSSVISLVAALTYIDDPGNKNDPARKRVQRREDRYVASYRKEMDRLNLEVTAGRWEYRDILTKHLQNTRNGFGGSVGYTLTQALRAAYALNIDRYEDNQMRTYSMLYLNAVRLEYAFPSETRLSLGYRITHGYSPDDFKQNYDNNSVVIELRKQF